MKKLSMRSKNCLRISVWTLAVALVLLAFILIGIYLGTQQSIGNLLELEITELPSDARVVVDKTDKYLGHPDMVLTDGGELITMYPGSHGRGAIITKKSGDFGQTWSERLADTPESWVNSQETPTLYKLEFLNGTSKILLVSGCPYWPGTSIKANGFNFSISADDGTTWSEFENVYSPADCIVAMSSLTRLKENGSYVDKWMGTFHTHKFVNYKTVLSFDENGKAHWSEPQPLLAEHRKIEKSAAMCELEIIRGENEHSDTLILLARANSRRTNSLISVSRDEGNTWTKPVELPYVLTGDRHKAEYDAESGRYVITFRSIVPPKSNALASDRLSAGWVGWIGTFDDLLSLADGDKSNDRLGDAFIRFSVNYNGNDCGYSGIVIKDGLVCAVSYGYFDAEAENPYILCVRFKPADYIN